MVYNIINDFIRSTGCYEYSIVVQGIYSTHQPKGFLQAPKRHSSSNPFCCSQEKWRDKKRERAV